MKLNIKSCYIASIILMMFFVVSLDSSFLTAGTIFAWLPVAFDNKDNKETK